MRTLREHRRRFGAVLGDGRGSVLVAISGGWFLSVGIMTIYPVILPQLRIAFGLDLTMAGLLVTGLWVVYGLGQFPAGLLSDRLGEGRVMALSMVVASGAVLLVVSAPSTGTLYLATMCLGAGTSLYGIARFTAINEVFPDHVGAANGVTDAAADGGQTVLPVIAGVLTAALAWEYGLGFMAPVLAATAVGIWLLCPSRTSPNPDGDGGFGGEEFRSLGIILRRPALFHGGIVFMGATIVWMVFMAFYPTYLVEQKGLTSTQASVLFGLFFGLGIVLKPTTGTIYDTLGVRRTFTGIILLAAGAMTLVALVDGLVALVLVTVAASILNGYNPPIISHLTTALPADIQGSGLGMIRTVALTLAALSPAIFGAIGDRGYFDEVFIILALVMLVLVFPLMRIPDTY